MDNDYGKTTEQCASKREFFFSSSLSALLPPFFSSTPSPSSLPRLISALNPAILIRVSRQFPRYTFRTRRLSTPSSSAIRDPRGVCVFAFLLPSCFLPSPRVFRLGFPFFKWTLFLRCYLKQFLISLNSLRRRSLQPP